MSMGVCRIFSYVMAEGDGGIMKKAFAAMPKYLGLEKKKRW